MRNLFLGGFFLFCFSCQSDQQRTEGSPAIKSPSTPTISAPSAPALRYIVSGVWIKATYLDALARTHSPQKVASEANLADGITAFEIDLAMQHNDSVEFDAIWNNHEGGLHTLLWKPDQKSQSFPVDIRVDDTYRRLFYSFRNGDTLLTLNEYDKQHKLLETTTYRRERFQPARSLENPVLNQGLERAVNKALIAGQYSGIDSTGKPMRAVFMPDGQVTGLGGALRYDVNIDFNGGPSTGEDMLFLDSSDEKRRRDVGYRINQDTLKLYTLSIDSIEAPHLHRLLYTLVRQH